MKRLLQPNNFDVLTIEQMGEADRLAVAGGVPSLVLMENAGRAVAEEIVARWSTRATAVLCGPGNNGGDGYVVARHLLERGWNVWAETLVDPVFLTGDAAEMFRRWPGETRPVTRARSAELVVDAMFGAGLSRPLDHNALTIALSLNQSELPVVAVDVPSGLHGNLGRSLGNACVEANLTVTFFRKKPGHILFPGRALCGETVLRDIGIPESVLNSIDVQIFENVRALWREPFPWPRADGHKYKRGSTLIVSGPAHATGAARLAARGALRIGSGLVSVASPLDAVAVNAAHLTAIMVKPFANAAGLSELLNDKRMNVVAIGPGLGIDAPAAELVRTALQSKAAIVLDADGLTCLPGLLRSGGKLRGDCVLTPHEGEFERLFPGLLKSAPSRLGAARDAAAQAGCVVVLKGPDTIIAHADGRTAINTNAPPTLATAGAGDVLAGFVAGLLAQGMMPFEAACAGVWLHGEAARNFGPGLIAEDLPEILPAVLKEFAEGA